MGSALRSFWETFLSPIRSRPRKRQVAALCHRSRKGVREYLLITSRGTGRWIIPKGWPIRGLESHEAAMQEAWEEAGVIAGEAANAPVGSYTYDKVLDDGDAIPVETFVYPIAVDDLAQDFPEADERTRRWVSATDAARLVNEPELRDIFRSQ